MSLSKPLYKVTPRLLIRPLDIIDFENWVQAHSNMRPPQNQWDMTNWNDESLTKKEFKLLLKKRESQQKQDEQYSFGVFSKDDGVLIGEVNLMDISRGIFQNAYIGYRIYNPHWGQGYATEAVTAATHLGIKNLKLHRLEAAIMPHNKASLKVIKKVGYQKEGLSRRRLLVDNKWEDMLIYALTAEDLKASQKAKSS